MPKQLFSNNATATLASAITLSQTTITLSSGKGALFSSPSAGDWELLTLVSPSAVEIIKMTARSGDVLTVARGQESTTAAAWPALSVIEARVTKGSLDRLLQNLGAGDEAIALTGTAAGDYAVSVGTGAAAARESSVVIGDGAKDAHDGAWQAATAYVVGDVVSDSGDAFMCTTAGTSGGSAPSWNTTAGAQTTDNTVTWLCVALAYSSYQDLVVLGKRARGIGDRACAAGTDSFAGKDAVAVGSKAHAVADSVAMGSNTNCHGEYGNIAIGSWNDVNAGEYTIAIGTDTGNTIDRTHVIGGPSLVKKAGSGGAGYIDVDYAGQESYIFSEEVDLETVADDVASIDIPTGATFYLNEVGVIVTEANTVTGQPSVSFGVTGNTVSILASTATTKSAAKGRDIFTPLIRDGVNSLTASVKTGATATTLLGRFYWKGILVEDQ